jgi:hypothetical protein
MQMLVQSLQGVVFDRPEECATQVILVPCLRKVLGNQALREE